ncbi:MAG: YqaJ viral recombinase family protein [Candidatus Brocadiaceae bacterium]|nr:YqaJ viral recombinase family protein [Candidatus Brocadiaceae bacterium]
MTPEIEAARVGNITASRIKDMLAEGKGVTRAKYAAQLASERMTGKPHRSAFGSASIEHGNETEAMARMQYEIRNGVMVIESGYVPHPHIKHAGCTPDGLVGDDGLVEFKCPDSHTFLTYKLKGEIPRGYRLQMIWQAACTGRKWGDYAPYDPDYLEQDAWIQLRLAPTEKEISDMEFEVIKFNLEVESLIEQIIARRTKA